MRFPLFVVLAISLSFGCGDDDGGGGGDAHSLDGGEELIKLVDASTTGPKPDGGTIATEICNGIDDDGNGKIDDIDVGGDGICDCLLIATLGIKGEWGDGDVFGDWLAAKSDNGVTELTPDGDYPMITSQMLAGYQIIVVQDIRALGELADSEVDAVEAWVQAGGGLMTLIGYGSSSERSNVNALLAPMGLSYDSTGILGGSPTVAVNDNWATHPTTTGVTAVGMDNGYAVVDSDGTGTVVAQEGGHIIAVAKSHGSGKVFVWGDEWITYNSEWAATDYQVEQYWLNLIGWLTPQQECEIDGIIID